MDLECVDLVLVDATHDDESVKADLLNWYPKINLGRFLDLRSRSISMIGSVRC
ncbi:MAG: hypothetical protein U7127_10325 [Phormidium sp.]